MRGRFETLVPAMWSTEFDVLAADYIELRRPRGDYSLCLISSEPAEHGAFKKTLRLWSKEAAADFAEQWRDRLCGVTVGQRV